MSVVAYEKPASLPSLSRRPEPVSPIPTPPFFFNSFCMSVYTHLKERHSFDHKFRETHTSVNSQRQGNKESSIVRPKGRNARSHLCERNVHNYVCLGILCADRLIAFIHQHYRRFPLSKFFKAQPNHGTAYLFSYPKGRTSAINASHP